MLRVERNDMYRHIRAKHGNEIVTKSLPETVSENHQKCDEQVLVLLKIYLLKSDFFPLFVSVFDKNGLN